MTTKSAEAPSSSQKAPQRNFRAKELLSLLRYTSDQKAAYALMILFCCFQMATYHGLSYVLKYLINDIFPTKNPGFMALFAAGWAGFFGVHAFFTLLSSKYRIEIVRGLVARIREEIVHKLQIISISYFDKSGTGATSAKILMDMDRLQGFYDWLLTTFLYAVIGIFLIVPFLLSIDPALTIFAFLFIPVIPLLQTVFRRMILRRSYLLRNTNERLSAGIVDFITGIRHIRMFAGEEEHGRQILDTVRVVRDVDIRYSFAMRMLQMAVQFVGEFMPVLLWVVAGVIMIRRTELSVGTVVAYIGLVRNLLNGISTIFGTFDQVVAASPSVAAILSIIRSHDIENPAPKIKAFDIDGSVEFEHVSFGYETREGRLQLADVSLRIEAGQRVALVGRSGSGKSTFVNVLLGLYPIKEGKIQFGSLDMRDIDLKRLRSQIAIMTQETFLFNTTIYENLWLVNTRATKDQIIEACAKAEIWEFIKTLPHGLDTHAGERGLQLSVGQRQRIGLARTFLRNPKIVILDEPSSALDVLTEHRMFETLYRHLESRTLIIIAHRLSTIKNVDRIFVFEDGRIVEQGSGEELQRRDGIFSQMVRASLAV